MMRNYPQRRHSTRSRAIDPASIERLGPIGVELAERAGRDYTTVSRQVAKLRS